MWTWLKDAVFWLLEQTYNFAGDWGLAIIIFTLVIRALMYPITAKQVKSSYAMQKVQPYITAIQEKYADDQKRMQEEMQKVYAEHKFNPLSGCLPLIITMPIFIILYQSLIENLPNPSSFYNIIPSLTASAATVINGSASNIGAAAPYIVLLVLFALSTFIPMLTQPNKQRQTLIMTAVMTVFMAWIGWRAPAGVMLYWVVSSYFSIGLQQLIKWRLKKKDEKAEIEHIEETHEVVLEPVEVNVKRRTHKPKPTKKR